MMTVILVSEVVSAGAEEDAHLFFKFWEDFCRKEACRTIIPRGGRACKMKNEKMPYGPKHPILLS